MLRKFMLAICLLMMSVVAIPAFAQGDPANVLPDEFSLADGYSYMKASVDRVTLVVCGSNVPGSTVYAVAFRDAIGDSINASYWPYILEATPDVLMSMRSPEGVFYENQCVMFDGYPDEISDAGMSGMEQGGPTYPEVRYYTQATLLDVVGAEMDMNGEFPVWERGECSVSSDGYGLCNADTAPSFVRSGFND